MAQYIIYIIIDNYSILIFGGVILKAKSRTQCLYVHGMDEPSFAAALTSFSIFCPTFNLRLDGPAHMSNAHAYYRALLFPPIFCRV